MLVSDHMTCILHPDWTRHMNEVNSDGNHVKILRWFFNFLRYFHSENTAKMF